MLNVIVYDCVNTIAKLVNLITEKIFFCPFVGIFVNNPLLYMDMSEERTPRSNRVEYNTGITNANTKASSSLRAKC